MKLIISSSVRDKLAKKSPPVQEHEIIQCFANRTHKDLIDTREAHLTNPMTRWFISQTDYGRSLKISYIPTKDGIVIKSAYDPNTDEWRIFSDFTTPIN